MSNEGTSRKTNRIDRSSVNRSRAGSSFNSSHTSSKASSNSISNSVVQTTMAMMMLAATMTVSLSRNEAMVAKLRSATTIKVVRSDSNHNSNVMRAEIMM